MTNADANDDIHSRITSFLSELSGLVKRSALEAVQAALGEGSPKRRGPGRPKGSGGRGPGRPRKAGRPKRAGKRVRRSVADLEKIAVRVLAHVKANAGHRLEQIGKALGTETAVLKRPIANLLAGKKLRTTGQKRGTMYFAGGGGGARNRRKKAQARVRRPARRTRKASRKKTARRAASRIVPRAPAKNKTARKPLPTAKISRVRAVANELAMDAAAMSTALP